MLGICDKILLNYVRTGEIFRRHTMRRSLKMFTILFTLILTACDKGLIPPDTPPVQINFPIPPEGGNPTGIWLPDATKPVEVTLLDEFPVDSIIFDTELQGIFSFEVTGVCSINAIMTLVPNIYVLGQELGMNITLIDTLLGNGPYEFITDEALYLPIQSNILNVDTLGFTTHQAGLDFITLPTTYTWENSITLRFYCLIHLTQQVEQASLQKDIIFTLRRKEKDLI